MANRTSGQGTQRGRTPGPATGMVQPAGSGSTPITLKVAKPKVANLWMGMDITTEQFRKWRQANAIDVEAVSSRGKRHAHVGSAEGFHHLGWGCFSWPIFWRLVKKAPVDGHIIQQITRVLSNESTGKYTTNRKYEAWAVKKDYRRPSANSKNTQDEYDDLYARAFTIDRPNGAYLVRGIAKFYPGPLPATFKVGAGNNSDLPTTEARPDFFEDTGLLRKVYVRWNYSQAFVETGDNEESLEQIWSRVYDESSTSRMHLSNGKADHMVPLMKKMDRYAWRQLGESLWKGLTNQPLISNNKPKKQ